MMSVSPLITQQPRSGLGLLSRKKEITSHHTPKENKVQETNESLQKKLCLGVAITITKFVLFLFLGGKKANIKQKYSFRACYS